MKNVLFYGDSNTWGYDYTTYDPALGSGRRMAFDERWTGRVTRTSGKQAQAPFSPVLSGDKTGVFFAAFYPQPVDNSCGLCVIFCRIYA